MVRQALASQRPPSAHEVGFDYSNNGFPILSQIFSSHTSISFANHVLEKAFGALAQHDLKDIELE